MPYTVTGGVGRRSPQDRAKVRYAKMLWRQRHGIRRIHWCSGKGWSWPCWRCGRAFATGDVQLAVTEGLVHWPTCPTQSRGMPMPTDTPPLETCGPREGSWSKTHYRKPDDRKKTLCGRFAGHLLSYDAGSVNCEACKKAAARRV